MDVQGHLTFLNPSAFEVFGYSQADFEQGLNVLDIIVPEDRDWARANIQRVLTGAHLGGIEYRIARKDGNRVPIIAHASRVMRDGQPTGLRGVAFDVSEFETGRTGAAPAAWPGSGVPRCCRGDYHGNRHGRPRDADQPKGV